MKQNLKVYTNVTCSEPVPLNVMSQVQVHILHIASLPDCCSPAGMKKIFSYFCVQLNPKLNGRFDSTPGRLDCMVRLQRSYIVPHFRGRPYSGSRAGLPLLRELQRLPKNNGGITLISTPLLRGVERIPENNGKMALISDAGWGWGHKQIGDEHTPYQKVSGKAGLT